MFDIDNHEKYILAVGYGKKIETEYKWNKLNLIDVLSLLDTDHCLSLSHMAKVIFGLKNKNSFYQLVLYWIYYDKFFE